MSWPSFAVQGVGILAKEVIWYTPWHRWLWAPCCRPQCHASSRIHPANDYRVRVGITYKQEQDLVRECVNTAINSQGECWVPIPTQCVMAIQGDSPYHALRWKVTLCFLPFSLKVSCFQSFGIQFSHHVMNKMVQYQYVVLCSKLLIYISVPQYLTWSL